MDSQILKLSWKVKLAAVAFGVVMSLSIYVVYVAGLKFNHLVSHIGEIAKKNAKEREAAAIAAKEEADRKAGILNTQIYGDIPKDK